MYLDPGDLPGWITALIALGGVIYGSYNLRSLILDRRRQQADKIYFGLEFDRAGRPSTTIHVMNLSDAPITLVQLLFVDYPERTWSAQWNRSALMMKDDWTVELEAPETFPVVVGYVSFTDATNRTWYKLSNGKLYSFDSHPGALARWRFFRRTGWFTSELLGCRQRLRRSGSGAMVSMVGCSDGGFAGSELGAPTTGLAPVWGIAKLVPE